MKKCYETCHALLQACMSVTELMKKNHYYTNDDLKHAMSIACQIIYGKIDVNLLKIGNHKLSKNVMIYDLPEVITCKYNCSNCYALKSSRCYTNTRVMRMYHFILQEACRYNKNIEKFIMDKMYNEIIQFSCKNIGMVYVRLHSSGDFYHDDYLQFMLKLIKKCSNLKNVKFYTYSKQLDNKKIDLINNSYHNFNIVKSLLEDKNGKKYINYGNDDYLKTLKNKIDDLFICSYGSKNQATCMGNCVKCSCHAHVAFRQH